MELIISAQDIRSITLGLAENGRWIKEETMEASPERYLLTINEFLQETTKGIEDVTACTVVTGPGSFTASRVSVTIANTIAYAKHIPVKGIENPDRLSLEALYVRTKELSEQEFVLPVYDCPPTIT